MKEAVVAVTLVFLVGILLGLVSGYDTGRIDQCKTMKAEYYKGECVIVQRKKVEL